MRDVYTPGLIEKMREVDLAYIRDFNPLQEINNRDNYS